MIPHLLPLDHTLKIGDTAIALLDQLVALRQQARQLGYPDVPLRSRRRSL
jgi:hypothetical protein